jgi:hypothetical protein
MVRGMTDETHHPDPDPPTSPEPDPPTAAAAYGELVDAWARWAEEHSAWLKGLTP